MDKTKVKNTDRRKLKSDTWLATEQLDWKEITESVCYDLFSY